MTEARRYKLTQDVIDSWYTQDGRFRFRIGFDKDNGHIFCPAQRCPTIDIADTDVIQTTNVMAQKCLRLYRIPQGVRRNGEPPPSGPTFEDVTDWTHHVDVDLDPFFTG